MVIVLKRLIKDIYRNRLCILIISVLLIMLSLFFHNVCPFVLITGYPCPGCGLTRAFLAFFTMHPLQAFSYNPSFILWLILIIYFCVLRYVLGRSVSKFFKLLLISTCLFTIAVYIFRMAYLFPGNPPMEYYSDNYISHIHRF